MKIVVVSNSLWPHGLYCPWNSPGQNTGVDNYSLLQRIFLTQGSNPTLQADSLPVEPPGKTKNPYPFFSGSSQKNPPAMQETTVQFLRGGGPLEKGREGQQREGKGREGKADNTQS